MGERYVEILTSDAANSLMGDKYDEALTYQLITDREGSYVSAFDKQTGARVDLDVHSDGIPDDILLDVDDFDLQQDFKIIEEDNDYTARSFGVFPIVIGASLMSFLAVTCYVFYVLVVRGG